MSSKRQKVVVVGAGPVGALAALYAAKRDFDVEVYELRGDLRLDTTTPLGFTKSVNLAMSERGINSLRKSQRPELLNRILERTIPMHSRMIHGRRDGRLFREAQKYDPHGREIRATDRSMLNKVLLDELEQTPNVKLCFSHKVKRVDFRNKTVSFEELGDHDTQSQDLKVKFDLLIGADGAHSVVRSNLMKVTRMFYQQEYIDTMWCEFVIRPASEREDDIDGFKLPPNYFHLWPAGTCVFIAIANPDKSFTCTLFMDACEFQTIDKDSSLLVPFFESHFPGIVDILISEADLLEQYHRNPHLPLISIKCAPYHYESSAVIVGDAAHAMVPFYGQGMNAGLEDVRVLFDHLDQHSNNVNMIASAEEQTRARGMALEAYTCQRELDAHAINDLAMQNYQELRADVKSPLYLIRKAIEESLHVYLPSLGWATRYSRVSFSNERYSEVVKATQKQGYLLVNTAATIGTISVLSMLAFGLLRRQPDSLLESLRTWQR